MLLHVVMGDLFSVAQAAQVYFKIYRQWQVSKSNDSMAVNYNVGLYVFIPHSMLHIEMIVCKVL